MEKNNYSNILLSEVEKIYKQISFEALEDNTGTYWKYYKDGDDNTIKEDIYLGTSGILIFLMEYYSLTKKIEVLDLIYKGSLGLLNYCKNNQTDNFAFYTGRVGTVHTLLRAWELTGNEHLVSETLLLIEKVCNVAHKKDFPNDFLIGLSGTILGLLFIYDQTKRVLIKHQIISLIKVLIQKTHITDKGFFWDKSPSSVKSLCGISHGASGVGLVFMELGRYFNNELFLEIACRSFDYENQFFNESENNWPDFRKAYSDIKGSRNYYKKYISGDLQFFHDSPFISAWCHGAPGIGLTRIRAAEIGLNRYSNDILYARRNLTHNDPLYKQTSDCLCHGSCGNNAIFLELYTRTEEQKYINLYTENCIGIIKYRSSVGKYFLGNPFKNTNDLSFFIGLSGIGYSFIKALNPNGPLSYLLPTIHNQSDETLEEFDYKSFYFEMIKKNYPLTTQSLVKISNLKNSSIYFNGRLTPLIKANIIPKSYSSFLFRLEIKKNKLSQKIQSYFLEQIISDVIDEKTETLIQANQLDLCFVSLNPKVELLIWDNLGDEKYFVLYPHVLEYRIMEVNKSLYLALKKLILSSKFCDFEINTRLSLHKARKKAIFLIKEGIIVLDSL